jgi:vesicle coat complex subunit
MLKVLKCLQHDEDAQVRSKALYCISSLLQNAPPIIEFFAKQ